MSPSCRVMVSTSDSVSSRCASAATRNTSSRVSDPDMFADASIATRDAMDPTGGPSPLRRLAFAGTWYAGDPRRLADDVDAALDAAGAIRSGARAVVSPHAGLMYSGRVAAHSYRALGSSP